MERIFHKYHKEVMYIVLVILTAVLMVFYQVMIMHGDNPAHIDVSKALLSGGKVELLHPHIITYPFYHLCVKLFSAFCCTNYYAAGAVVLTISNIAAILISRYVMNNLYPEAKPYIRYIIDLMSICSVFFQTIASPLTDWRIYKWQGSANPWHNPTTTFVRPFGILSFFLFLTILKQFRKGEIVDKTNLCVWSVITALSVIAKPSYAMVLMPASGLLVFIYWLANFKTRFRSAMRILIAALPTICLVVFQFVYTQYCYTGTPHSVEMVWGGVTGFSTIEILKSSIAVLPVPLVTFLLCNKVDVWKQDYMKLSSVTLFVGWIEAYLFTNGPSGDFFWGYGLSIGLSTMMSLLYMIKDCKQRWKKWVVFIIFAIQVLVGVYYFWRVYQLDGNYYF